MSTVSINLRIPQELHTALKDAAEQDRLSLNATVLNACESWLAMRHERNDTGKLKNAAAAFMRADTDTLRSMAVVYNSDEFHNKMEKGLAEARKVRKRGKENT